MSRFSLRARCVFPVVGEPIADGVVTVAGGRIVAVGRRAMAGRVEDLGNVAVLPGLVNAHVHLEFSNLAEPLGNPGIGMVDWLRQVVERFRPRRAPSAETIARGLGECIASGTTSLGEIAQPGWPVEPFTRAGIDATIFLELIAPTAERVRPLLALATRHVRAAEPTGYWRPGLSPHAPYSVRPELLAAAVSLSASRRLPLAFHLAESRDEIELLRSGSGPLRDFLDERSAYQPDMFAPDTRPLDYLRTLAAAHRTLVIHGNYLDGEEIALLAERAERMSVVYCPRSHAHFRHDPYPLGEMLSAGVTVALGTDSRASSPDLSLLAEMRFLARQHPAVTGDVVLRLGTLAGARALGRADQIGSLEAGKLADLAVVALPEHDAADPHELLFDAEQPVVATWRSGVESGKR